MNKIAKLLILIGICFVVLAIALSLGNINKLISPFYNDDNYDYLSYLTNENITKIISNTKNDSVQIKPYNGDKVKVTYTQGNNHNYQISEANNILTIERQLTIKWLISFNFNFKIPQIIIEVPEDSILSYDIKSNNAKISISDLTILSSSFKNNNASIDFSNIKSEGTQYLQTDNAQIRLNNIEIFEIIADTDNAKIEASNILANNLKLVTSNGRIEADSITAEKVDFKTTNGRINFNNLNSKIIFLKNTNGRIEGTINSLLEEYQKSIKTTNGKITINGSSYGTIITDNIVSENKLDAKTTNGSINIDFRQ